MNKHKNRPYGILLLHTDSECSDRELFKSKDKKKDKKKDKERGYKTFEPMEAHSDEDDDRYMYSCALLISFSLELLHLIFLVSLLPIIGKSNKHHVFFQNVLLYSLKVWLKYFGLT